VLGHLTPEHARMISDNLNAFPAGLACWAPTPAGSARASAIAATSGSHLQHARITPPALRAGLSTVSSPLLLLSGDGSDPHRSSSSPCTTAALGAAPDPIVVGGPVPPRASRGGSAEARSRQDLGRGHIHLNQQPYRQAKRSVAQGLRAPLGAERRPSEWSWSLAADAERTRPSAVVALQPQPQPLVNGRCS
jgi:hypothetical protein